MWWLYLIGFVIVGGFLFLLSKITIIFHFYYKNKDMDLYVEIKIWRFIKIKREIPLANIDLKEKEIELNEKTKVGEETASDKREDVHFEELKNNLLFAKDILKHISSFSKIIKKFLSKVNVEKLDWESKIGLGDAAATGMGSGVLWTIKGWFIGWISHNMRLKVKPDLQIAPHFQHQFAYTNITCILSFRIGQAILVLLTLLKNSRGLMKTIQLHNKEV
ncbi:DUF2953 domain-containing protein [Bacillaceae bacterium S4-13-56]